MFKAIEYFTDLQDNNYEYKVGAVYPREGYTPTADRIAELLSSDNIRGRAVIAEEKPARKKVEVPVQQEETAETEEEKPKKRKHKADEE